MTARATDVIANGPEITGGLLARSSVVVFGAQAVRFLVQLATVLVTARLLSPEDFGLVAMAGAVTGFAGLFADLGVPMAIVQRPRLTRGEASGLFWMILGGAVLIAFMVAAGAPLAGWFFGEPRVTPIIVVSAVVIVVAAAGSAHRALLERSMAWARIRAVEISGLVVGSVTTILIAAYTDLGYWALVVGALVGQGTSTPGFWLASGWLPGLRGFSLPRDSVQFSLALSGFNVLNYWARKADDLLIGWAWGAGQLGLYTRAYGLMLLPLTHINNALAGLAISSLSRLKSDPNAWKGRYLQLLALVLALTTPLAVFTYIEAEAIVRILLGDQWLKAVPILRAFAICMLVQPIMNSTGWIYTSTGRAREMMFWAAGAVPILVASFGLGLPFGAEGVAWAYAIANLLLLYPSLFFATRGTALDPGVVARLLCPPIFAAALASLFLLVDFPWEWTWVSFESSLYLPARTALMGSMYVAIMASICARRASDSPWYALWLAFQKNIRSMGNSAWPS